MYTRWSVGKAPDSSRLKAAVKETINQTLSINQVHIILVLFEKKTTTQDDYTPEHMIENKFWEADWIT